MRLNQSINITVQIPNSSEICDFQIFKTYNSVLESEIESTKIRNGYYYIEIISKKIVKNNTGTKIVASCRGMYDNSLYSIYTSSGAFYTSDYMMCTNLPIT